MSVIEDLAAKAASALEELGSCGSATWKERRDALIAAINADGGSGASEVLAWFDADTSAID